MNKLRENTYLYSRSEINHNEHGTCFYEFQRGKYECSGGSWFKPIKLGTPWKDDSIYLCDDEFSEMAPFNYFIKEFDPYGINYLNKESGINFVTELRNFSKLLNSGKPLIEILEYMKLYDSTKPWELQMDEKMQKFLIKKHKYTKEKISQIPIESKNFYEQNLKSLDLTKLQNTTTFLSNWIEENLKTFDTISICGI